MHWTNNIYNIQGPVSIDFIGRKKIPWPLTRWSLQRPCLKLSILAKRAKKSTVKDESAKIDMKLLETIGLIGESLSKNESAGEAFGRTVAIALDDMLPKERMEAQLKSQQILLDYIA